MDRIRAPLITVLVLVAGCAMHGSEARAADITPTQSGRFAIVISPSGSESYLLDTATGKIWHKERFENGGIAADAWVPMERLNTGEEVTEFARQNGPCGAFKDEAYVKCLSERIDRYNEAQRKP